MPYNGYTLIVFKSSTKGNNMQTNHDETIQYSESMKGTGQQIIDLLEKEMVKIQTLILTNVKRSATQFTELHRFRQEIQQKFAVPENNAQFNQFSKLISELIYFGVASEVTDNTFNTLTPIIIRSGTGRFINESGRTIADYSLEAMNKTNDKIIHVDKIVKLHNEAYSDFQVNKRQVANALRKLSKKGHIVIAHGGNKFSLIEKNDEKKSEDDM